MVSGRFNQLGSEIAVNQQKYIASDVPLELSCNHRPHGWQ
jgi:hypothetical protein